MSGVRIDAWLWAVRLYKTRSAATAAVRAGHVRIDGEPVKAATPVVVGNRVRVRQDGRERILEVTGLIAKRVGAPVARQQYVDHSPPPVPRELLAVRTASAARAGPPSVTAGSWTRCAAATDAERLSPPRAVIRRRDGGLMRRVRSAPSGTACRCPP